MKKISFLTMGLLIASSVAFAEEPATTPTKLDNDNVNTACAADAATAGCGSTKVGSGLLLCLHAYKKAHKEFKFADACKMAMRQRKMDKKVK